MHDRSGTKCGAWTAVRSFGLVLCASIVSTAELYTIWAQYFTGQSPARCSHPLTLCHRSSPSFILTESVRASLSTGYDSSIPTGHGLSCNQPQSNPFRRRLKIRVSSDRIPGYRSVVGDDRAGNLHREWATSTVLPTVQITVSVSSPRGITRDWGDIIISFHLTSPCVVWLHAFQVSGSPHAGRHLISLTTAT